MKRKTDFKYLETMNENEKANFLFEIQKLKHYYKEMFDIEIIDIYYRKNIDKLMDRVMKSKDYLSNMRIGVFPITIKIKDNNKKVFKIKNIKGNIDFLKFRTSEIEAGKAFLRNILTETDERIGNYCRYMYIDRIDNNSVVELIKRNDELNSKFIYSGKDK